MKKVLKFSLELLCHVLGDSVKESKKEYEPTLEETMRGEKLPFSDGYFIPSKDSQK